MGSNLERQLALVNFLSKNKKGFSRIEIEKAMPAHYPSANKKAREASRKKLQRDAESLSAGGMPILCVQNPSGNDHFKMGPGAEPLPDDFVLNGSEALGLRHLLEDPILGQQMDEPSRRALANLLAFHAPFDIDAKGEALPHSPEEARLARLLAMSRSETVAQISYPSRAGSIESRHISPIGAWLFRGSSYVVGMCHRDIVPKTFSISRIQRLEAAANVTYIEAPNDFDLETHATRNEFRLEQEIGLRKVEVRVEADEAWRLKELTPEAITRDFADGAVLAQYEITAPRRFYKFLLGFGRSAEIKSPKTLRDGFSTFLKGFL